MPDKLQKEIFVNEIHHLGNVKVIKVSLNLYWFFGVVIQINI